MISFFRNIFKSKLGLGLTFALIAVIALAFAAGDITGSTFGGVAGNDRVARVGSERISTSVLTQNASSALEQMRREDPTTTMPMFVERGGIEEVLDQLIDRYAIGGYAEKFGLRAGDNLVNSEILQISAFRGVAGEFDQTVYEAALRRQGLTDATLRSDLADGLLAQQMLLPALAQPQIPLALAKRYGSFVNERRQGSIALIPSTTYVPEDNPTEEQLQVFYDENRARYILPERRILRYATFGDSAISDRVDPTEAEIAARFERDALQYEAQETRVISSLFVPTEDAARALSDRVTNGASLEAAAQEAGFSVTKSEPRSKEQFAATASEAVADAVFAASRGAMAAPARSALGWYVARIDEINRTPARSLEDVSNEIAVQLTAEKRAAALADLSTRIEDRVADRAALSEIAEEFDLTLELTPPVLADGRVFGDRPGQVAPQLRTALETAFQMDEAEPQLAEIVRGEQFLVFEVQEITSSAPAPLTDITEEITTDWKLAQGDTIAREAADRVLAALESGETDLAAALRAEEGLPPPQAVNLTRAELQPQQGQRIPTALVLLFSMAEGTVKRLEAPNDLGWFIVQLDDITATELEAEDPLLAQAQASLVQTFSTELASQFTNAIRNELGVDRNETAIEAVRTQLSGGI